MSPGGMALVAPVIGAHRRARHRLCRPRRPARRHRRAAFPERLRDDDRGDPAQARQARGPAHLARQPSHPRPAGRPPPRPCGAAQSGGAPDPAERHQHRRARHRHLVSRAAPSRPTSGRRSAPWSPSARRPDGWCATSKTASRSSSSACSTRTSSKTTSPAGKRFDLAVRAFPAPCPARPSPCTGFAIHPARSRSAVALTPSLASHGRSTPTRHCAG